MRKSVRRRDDLKGIFMKYKREKEEKERGRVKGVKEKEKEKGKGSDYHFMSNIEFSLGELKKEGLMEINTLVNGCNKLIENKELKMLF